MRTKIRSAIVMWLVEGDKLITALDEIGQNDQSAGSRFSAQREALAFGPVSANKQL